MCKQQVNPKWQATVVGGSSDDSHAPRVTQLIEGHAEQGGGPYSTGAHEQLQMVLMNEPSNSVERAIDRQFKHIHKLLNGEGFDDTPGFGFVTPGFDIQFDQDGNLIDCEIDGADWEDRRHNAFHQMIKMQEYHDHDEESNVFSKYAVKVQ